MADIDEKKEKKIKIAGWEFSTKQIMIFAILVLLIIGGSKYSEYKEKQEILERDRINRENMENGIVVEEDTDRDYLQEALIAEYGNPQPGFKWNVLGELVPIGDEMMCEDVVFTFLRSLSVLDFAVAERYSLDSSVISNYKEYFSIVTQGLTNYYDNFLRKQYGESIVSLSIDKVHAIAVFADGTQYVTIDISCLDLTDKDFWVKDRDELFAQMKVYKSTEEDDTKVKQYIYDYLYNSYIDGKVGKKQYTISLACDKNYGGGWLVVNDKELDAVLKYENGVDVAQYILNEFESWYIEDNLNSIMEEVNS